MIPKKTFICAVVLLLGALISAGFSGAAFAEENARHIIMVIGDGMQLEHEIAASRYLFGRNLDLSFHKLPVQTNIATWDVTTYNYWSTDGPYDPAAIRPCFGYAPMLGGKLPYPMQTVGISKRYLVLAATDSASAATAWATGFKTDDGNIAWLPGDPPGGALKTIAEILRDEKGYAVGVVSTVPFSHATPAAHVSHNISRNNYHAIAREILTVFKPDAVIGGGHPLYRRNYGYIPRDIYENFKNGLYGNEYVFVERTGGIDGGVSVLKAARQASAQGKKLFGLFGGRGGEFESPQPSDTPGAPAIKRATIENPLLKDAAMAALEVLGKDPDGFFLMLEQGDIDWANHANDYAHMVGATWDLHAAVAAVIDYVNRDGDDITWGNTLLIVTADHANSYMRLAENIRLTAGDLPAQKHSGIPGATFAYPDGEVTYGSTGHTNELTRLYAIGKMARLFKEMEGKWYPGTRIIDNTQIFHVMMRAAGNPAASSLTLITDNKNSCPKKDSDLR